MNYNSSADIKYITIDEQLKIIQKLDELAQTEPLWKTFLYTNGSGVSLVTLGAVYFAAWRAGFRGYGLSKYGKARLATIGCGLIFPVNGYFAHENVQNSMKEPFRIESAWNYGWKHALYDQVGTITSAGGGLLLTYVFAHRAGLLPIPDGMHKPGVREVAVGIFFSRVKRYTKSIVITAAASTTIMFFVGLGSYAQSCYLLGRLGRKTLALKED